MKTYVWLAPLVLSASVILPGCQDSNTPGTNTPTAERRGSETKTKMSDSDLEKTIKARLESDNSYGLLWAAHRPLWSRGGYKV